MPRKLQPILVRIAAGRVLNMLRTNAKKSYADCQTARLGSRSKLERIESGRQGLDYAQVKHMCEVYGADAETTTMLLEMVGIGVEDAWWERYGILPEWFRTYVELESMASSITIWDGYVVPGLLQSPAYQRAMFAIDGAENPDRQLEMRQKRQRSVLERGVDLVGIVGEAALNQNVGGAEGMREQRDYLRYLAAQVNVEIRVLPNAVGANPGMKGPFYLLEFDSTELPSVVYFETYGTGRYDSSETVLRDFRRRWRLLYQQSVPIEEHLR